MPPGMFARPVFLHTYHTFRKDNQILQLRVPDAVRCLIFIQPIRFQLQLEINDPDVDVKHCAPQIRYRFRPSPLSVPSSIILPTITPRSDLSSSKYTKALSSFFFIDYSQPSYPRFP